METSIPDPLLVPDPKNQPGPEQGQPVTIRPGSGLAMIGLFVEIIRKRFPAGSGLPWTWDADPKKMSVAIESAFNEDKAHRNFRAAIYVDHDDQVTGRTVIGDSAGQNLKTGLKGFWALRTTPIVIECVASKRAESATLGDLVDIYLHASNDLIQAKFGLHEMTPPTLGRTQPSARDKEQWITPINFSVQYAVRWTNIPTGPLLQDIALKVSGSGFENATDYFEEIALGTGLK